MIATLLSPLVLKLGGFFLAALGALGALFVVRQSGVKAQQNADLKSTLKNVEAAHETSTSVARMSDAAVDQQLRSQFSRD